MAWVLNYKLSTKREVCNLVLGPQEPLSTGSEVLLGFTVLLTI